MEATQEDTMRDGMIAYPEDNDAASALIGPTLEAIPDTSRYIAPVVFPTVQLWRTATAAEVEEYHSQALDRLSGETCDSKVSHRYVVPIEETPQLRRTP